MEEQRLYDAMINLRLGGKGRFSMADIQDLLISLPKAKKVLSDEQYRQLVLVHLSVKINGKQREMDIFRFQKISYRLIEEYNRIAPMEAYKAEGRLADMAVQLRCGK